VKKEEIPLYFKEKGIKEIIMTTPQEHHARFLYLETITKQTLAKIDKAMINRSNFGYIEVLKNLKNEKARLLKI
jgi:hypothetical protein